MRHTLKTQLKAQCGKALLGTGGLDQKDKGIDLSNTQYVKALEIGKALMSLLVACVRALDAGVHSAANCRSFPCNVNPSEGPRFKDYSATRPQTARLGEIIVIM
jgi:hypothetical protein